MHEQEHSFQYQDISSKWKQLFHPAYANVKGPYKY
jgi:hypothetical protein